MDRWIDGQMDGEMDGWMNGEMDGWLDGQMDDETVGWMYDGMAEGINEWIGVLFYRFNGDGLVVD